MHVVSGLTAQHLADSRVCWRRLIWHRSSSANIRRETCGMIRPSRDQPHSRQSLPHNHATGRNIATLT